MATPQDYDALAERWAMLIVDLDVLLGDSDTMRIEVPNITYHAFAALRSLPDQIRDGRAVAAPLTRHDEPPAEQ